MRTTASRRKMFSAYRWRNGKGYEFVDLMARDLNDALRLLRKMQRDGHIDMAKIDRFLAVPEKRRGR